MRNNLYLHFKKKEGRIYGRYWKTLFGGQVVGFWSWGLKRNNLPEFISHVSTSTSLSRANFGEGFESESSQLQEGCRRVAVEKAMHVLGGKCQEKSSPFTFHLSMPIYHVAYKYTCVHIHITYILIFMAICLHALSSTLERKATRTVAGSKLLYQVTYHKRRRWTSFQGAKVRLRLASFYHSTPSWKQKEISKKSIFLKGDRIERFGNNMSTLCEVFLQPRFILFYSAALIHHCLMTPMPRKKRQRWGARKLNLSPVAYKLLPLKNFKAENMYIDQNIDASELSALHPPTGVQCCWWPSDGTTKMQM